jgi:hypothetical protein
MIHIATPAFGGWMTSHYTHSIFRLLNKHGLNWDFSYGILSNESDIRRARSKLATRFLESDDSWLLFIDADIGFDPSSVEAMLRSCHSLIGGIYPKKEFHLDRARQYALHKVVHSSKCLDFAVSTHRQKGDTDGGPIKVDRIGFGMFLMERDILEEYIDTMDVQDFYCEREGRYFKDIFTSGVIPTGEYLTEDYMFCHNVTTKLGYTIYGYPGTFTHVGQCAYTGNYTDYLA